MTVKKTIDWPMPFTSPEEVGVESKQLSRIGPTLQRFISKKMASNFVNLVARKGKVVHYEARGYMDFETKKKATTDTIYRLYSNTKPITGVAVMICVEEGLISLDDPVSKYIPAFKNQRVRTTAMQGLTTQTPTVPVDRDITIRDCLRNTTGITTARHAPLTYLNEFKDNLQKSGVLTALGNKPTCSIRESMDALAKLPLESQPGTRFEYHVGYPIIGVILEIVTGQSLESFYQKRIFKPLGMKDTSFYLKKGQLGRFPTLYTPIREKGKWKLSVYEKPEKSPKVTGPKNYFEAGGGAAGGLLSTVADYARFGQMLLNGGELDGVRIISRKSVEIMTSSHTGDMVLPLPGPGFGFGIGVGVYKGGIAPINRSIGTYGWSGAGGTNFFADPKEDLICICFSQVLMHNIMGTNTYIEEFERIAYQSLL